MCSAHHGTVLHRDVVHEKHDDDTEQGAEEGDPEVVVPGDTCSTSSTHAQDAQGAAR